MRLLFSGGMLIHRWYLLVGNRSYGFRPGRNWMRIRVPDGEYLKEFLLDIMGAIVEERSRLSFLLDTGRDFDKSLRNSLDSPYLMQQLKKES